MVKVIALIWPIEKDWYIMKSNFHLELKFNIPLELLQPNTHYGLVNESDI